MKEKINLGYLIYTHDTRTGEKIYMQKQNRPIEERVYTLWTRDILNAEIFKTKEKAKKYKENDMEIEEYTFTLNVSYV